MHTSWAASGPAKIAMAIGIMQVEVQLLSMHQGEAYYRNDKYSMQGCRLANIIVRPCKGKREK